MEEYTFARKNLKCPAKSEATSEASRLGVSAIGFTGAIMGLWAFACLAGAMASSGGPLTLVKSWFGAVLGL